MTPAKTLSLTAARRAWFDAQLAPAPLLEVPGGWTRALGGVDPYLALRARIPDLRRADVDAATSEGALWVVPGVRNCIWLVPRAEVPLALAVSRAQSERRVTREYDKLGVTRAELDDLCEAVLAVLSAEPLDPNGLRDALPEGTWRSLGDAGKKIGHTTTLPMALRELEWQGRLRRHLVGGRLDTQRYAWRLLDSPLQLDAPTDPAEQAVLLARRFFRWAGPETLDAFVGWATIGKRHARAAMAAIELVPVAIEGRDAEYWCLPEQLASLGEPTDDRLAFLPAQDNLLALRTHIADLAAPAHHRFELEAIGGRRVPLSNAKWMNQRALIRGGEWVGLWEWDEASSTIVLGAFDRLPPGAQTAAAEVADFIRTELEGVARANSIDGVKARSRRVSSVKRM